MNLYPKRVSYLKLFGKEAFLNQAVAKLGKSPRRLFGAVICGVGIVLLVASIAGGLGGAPPPGASQPQSSAANSPDVSTDNEAAKQNPSNEQNHQPTQQNTSKPAPQTQTNTPQTQGTNTTATNTESPSKPEPATIEVSLTINNTYKGKVSLPEGSNQCDVLIAAHDAGIIQSVELVWYAQHRSYFVKKIDDVGGNWTYTVNQHGPPGCSLVQAKNGDQIHWKSN